MHSQRSEGKEEGREGGREGGKEEEEKEGKEGEKGDLKLLSPCEAEHDIPFYRLPPAAQQHTAQLGVFH